MNDRDRAIRKAARKVVRLSKTVERFSQFKVDDAIDDLARVLSGGKPLKTYELRGRKRK